jgi:hypothetical protein
MFKNLNISGVHRIHFTQNKALWRPFMYVRGGLMKNVRLSVVVNM